MAKRLPNIHLANSTPQYSDESVFRLILCLGQWGFVKHEQEASSLAGAGNRSGFSGITRSYLLQKFWGAHNGGNSGAVRSATEGVSCSRANRRHLTKRTGNVCCCFNRFGLVYFTLITFRTSRAIILLHPDGRCLRDIRQYARHVRFTLTDNARAPAAVSEINSLSFLFLAAR